MPPSTFTRALRPWSSLNFRRIQRIASPLMFLNLVSDVHPFQDNSKGLASSSTACSGLAKGLERHWMRRIELALLMNSRADAELWHKKSEGFMSDSTSSRALSLIARSVRLDSTFTRASIDRFRPSSDNPEFGAVPYGQSVVFVSASIGSGYASQVDGWSGRRYTELRHVPERDSSEQPVLLGQKMRRSDVYMASLAGGWHNGPVTFSKDGSWMVVTQSHSAQDAHDTAGRKAQNLKLSFFQQNGADNWEDITRQVFAFNDSTHSGAMQPWTLPTTLCFPATDQEDLEAWISGALPEWINL